ncbi:hypothetical protein NIES4073_52950 [Kalymmatonema gypsitolerans NIES-4073]|nr:hypothetical protein NIES4073_52950 [Scytonema sp. NIES-4073]
MVRTKNNQKNNNGAKLGFEETLCLAADKQRGHMDAAEDTLLPKLLSGEIRVKEAEKMMEVLA